MSGDLSILPDAARTVVEVVGRRWREQDGLLWAYGQGSVFSGFREDSDLDVVAVWERVPDSPTLSDGGEVLRHGDLLLEKTRQDGYEIDIQHVPRNTFESWLASLERGEGWSGEQWPMPVHVAAGLAEGLLVVDPRGTGEALKRRLQTPHPWLVETVMTHLHQETPGFVRELDRAARAGDLWLHDLLAVQLHRSVYVGWFLGEGHYPPFPKHLRRWYERFGMSPTIQDLEASYWRATGPGSRAAVLSELASAVLGLRR